MATIEKEKALDVVRQMVEDGQISQEVAEKYFPELKESEDERIRKQLIVLVKSSLAHTDEEINEMIAWLEKQGKRDARNKYLEELLEADTIYQMAMNDAMVEEAKNKAIKALQELAVSKLLGLEKQGEQKPADNTDLVLNILNKENREVQQEDLIKKPSLINNENEMILSDVISILDNGFMPSSMERARLVKGLQSIKLQPKQEWSEEDETVLNNLIYALANDRIGNDRDEYISWLKSLKDRYTWKPSDEQIKALEHFVRSVGESGYASPYDNDTKLIYSLLEQLKQL